MTCEIPLEASKTSLFVFVDYFSDDQTEHILLSMHETFLLIETFSGHQICTIDAKDIFIAGIYREL